MNKNRQCFLGFGNGESGKLAGLPAGKEEQPMPSKPKHPCKHPGCNALISSGSYCPEHTQTKRGPSRESAARRGYGREWQRISREYLAAHPWCAECQRRGVRTPATEVDHRTPHKGNRKLFWDKENWQPLCHSCHSAKTAKEDGGFGRRGPTKPRGRS